MSELHSRLQAALGPAYRVERELGGGGMSRVFLAEDVELGRRVVVKVLPPEMAAGVNQDRFRREIQLAAQLQHPHIVPVHTAGSAGDLLWYVMPFVEGESLRARLARGGELPVPEAVRILREVADALAYAHGKGVVHRDIKPDNVLLAGKHAQVTDFGVAKAVSDATGAQALTSFGLALGTPAYMAPEQAAGEPTLDHRADLYALGAMAYEMLTGRPPFSGITAQAILGAHLTQTPEPITTARPAVPPALGSLVMRCLEKRPADRWQSAEELGPLLESLLTPSGSAPPVDAASISSGTEAAIQKRHPLRVAALFALGGVALLAMVWWLVQRLGLPNWVVTAAGALLVIGLPVVLIAARQERARLLAQATGGVARRQTGVLARFTTLRGAMAGGGLAFLGLTLGTALFMGLRILGIGPFATLVSAGVLRERDLLVVADFANTTSDSTLGPSLGQALTIDLGQSQLIRIAERSRISEGLERMQQSPDSPLSEEVAREVAARIGAKGVVVGDVSRLGSGYVISVRLLAAESGEVLSGTRETAADEAALIGALDRLSRKLRESIGESLRSIRSQPPLEAVTTGSLEALGLYSASVRATDRGDLTESVRLLEQAIALDSGFAMAWRKLAVALFNTRADPALEARAAWQAFELRERLPRQEADLAVAYYHQATGNRRDAIAAYERMLTLWPDNVASRNNLALLYNSEQRFGDAERLLREAVDSGASVTAFYDNLIDAQLFQNRIAAAESTIAAFARAIPANVSHRRYWAQGVAYAAGRYEEALAFADSLSRSDDPAFQQGGAESRQRTLVITGRLREVSGVRGAVTGSNPVADLDREILLAQVDGILLGDPDAGARRLDAAVTGLESIPPAERPYPALGATYARFGRAERARVMAQGFEATARPGERFYGGNREWVRASAAAGAGRWTEAIQLYRQARQAWGCPACLLPDIGYAFDQLGQPDSALAVYERYVSLPNYWPINSEIDLPLTLRRLGSCTNPGAIAPRPSSTTAASSTPGRTPTPNSSPRSRKYAAESPTWRASPEAEPSRKGSLARRDRLDPAAAGHGWLTAEARGGYNRRPNTHSKEGHR